MAVTRAQLAAALRVVDSSDSGDGPVLDRLIAAASATVAVATDKAPVGVADEAVIRFASWLYDAPPEATSGTGWRSCGAAGLLDPWRVRAFAAFGGGESAAAPAPSGSGLPPLPGSGNYILAVDNGVLTWVEFPKP